MRSLARYLPIIPIAFCFLPGHFFHHFMTGPALSLWNRLVLGIPCAWLFAILVGSISLVFTRTLPERKRIFILTISIVVLFFPLRGLSRGIAEELELRERLRTRYYSESGVTFMYGEMSGMGHARGLKEWPSLLLEWFLLATITAVYWLPLAWWFSRWAAR